MTSDEVIYSTEDHVATIAFNRPEVRNAFGETTRDRLESLLNQAEQDDDIGCVIITGVGDAFAAGGDVKSMGALQAKNDASVLATRMQTASRVVQLIPAMKKPVIAAINGPAAGGALNLALACDIRIAAENAIFAQSFVKIGLVPDWGGHYLLTRVVGTSMAMELMMLGERFDAAEALRLGIVNHVFAMDTFREEVTNRAVRLAAGPREAISAIKRGVRAGAQESLANMLAFEEREQSRVFLSDDAREGIRAFAEKRAPKFGNFS